MYAKVEHGKSIEGGERMCVTIVSEGSDDIFVSETHYQLLVIEGSRDQDSVNLTVVDKADTDDELEVSLYHVTTDEVQDQIDRERGDAPGTDESEPPAVALTGAIWRVMDSGLDTAQVRDAVDQAIETWEPNNT